MRRAMAAVSPRPAQPGVLSRTRTWVGSVLIRLGTSLQVETREPGAPRQGFPRGHLMIPHAVPLPASNAAT